MRILECDTENGKGEEASNSTAVLLPRWNTFELFILLSFRKKIRPMMTSETNLSPTGRRPWLYHHMLIEDLLYNRVSKSKTDTFVRQQQAL